jgi:hypothetical protein
VRELGLAAVDLVEALDADAAAAGLDTPAGEHLTPRGYALAAAAVLRALEAADAPGAAPAGRAPG